MIRSQSNGLLESLSLSEQTKILEQCVPLKLPRGKVLYAPGTTPRFAHFITSGVSSIVVSMQNTKSLEVGIVGQEGMPQALHLLGSLCPSARCVMQTPGSGLQISFKVLEGMFHRNDQIRDVILGFVQYQSFVGLQLSACNRVHGVEGRLARWLLMIRDRTGDALLRFTQEFLSNMIGSQRTTVSEVAGSLQKQGLIEYSRGSVRITDHEGLEKASCECYAITRKLLRDIRSVRVRAPSPAETRVVSIDGP